MNPLRIAVAGATGRMGRALVRLIRENRKLELVGAATTDDDPLLGQNAGVVAGVPAVDVPITVDLPVETDVLIEFTLPNGCANWATWCAERGVPMVSGTTGLSAQQQKTLEDAAQKVPLVWAPNMSVGVNLLLDLAAQVASRLGIEWDVEIAETHHRRKVDAPSGTANAILEQVCTARGQKIDDVTVHGRSGACGARPPGEVGVHALRMGSVVGEHKLHFTSDSESLTLRHRAFSRDTFAAGALRAAQWIPGRAPGLYGMADVLRD